MLSRSFRSIRSFISLRDTLSVTDNRTGKTIEIPIKHNTISAKELLKLNGNNVNGIRSYDPSYFNTANASSKISYIDGDKGILNYRGYPIEQLAEKSTFIEVTYLLLYGELPTKDQLKFFTDRVMKHSFVHEDLTTIMKTFRYDAHPMGVLIASLSALGTLHPDSNPALVGDHAYDSSQVRNKQIHRVIGGMPTMAGFAYRHRIGRPFNNSSHLKLSYCENFLYMLDHMSNPDYRPNPRLARALDILFILHAEHEMNCSTAMMRHLASSGVDVYSCLSGATAALYGPSHGGANAAVIYMLQQIGKKENVPKFIEDVKNKKALLMGFGHRVYKSYDPRARIIKSIADEVFSIVGQEPLIEIAVELERIALSDPYFIERKLYPNVDFYSGLIYKAMGFPTDFFPLLFAIPRMAGWMSHWLEFQDDKENNIIRPRQVYLGEGKRDYVSLQDRKIEYPAKITSKLSPEGTRRFQGLNTP